MNTAFDGLNTSSRIKGILASQGKTKRSLAEHLKLNYETVSTRMKLNEWKLSELYTIAEWLGVPITDLI